jgi:hypothetical protein
MNEAISLVSILVSDITGGTIVGYSDILSGRSTR